MLLYQPTGKKELALVFQTNMCLWPPRLADQPIFYPVLNQPYAAQIARDWNTKFNTFVGYVTRFEVDDAYAANFKVEKVGGREHLELWVPAESLAEFNQKLTSRIEVLEAFFGTRFDNRESVGLLSQLEQADEVNTLAARIEANAEAVFLHYPYWKVETPEKFDLAQARKAALLEKIELAWQEKFPDIHLCQQGEKVNL